MFDSKRTKAVDNREVHFCRLCGAEIAKLFFSNGDPYWTDVIHDRQRGRIVITGEGNNYNFKPQHDCLKIAVHQLEACKANHQNFTSQLETARKNHELFKQNEMTDDELRRQGVSDKLIEAVRKLERQAEANFTALSGQKEATDGYLEACQKKVDALKRGESIIPQEKPFIGRQVRVIKGRKVKPGTEGKVFWMGLDNFKEGIRIGLETQDGIKHYTDEGNVEVVQK